MSHTSSVGNSAALILAMHERTSGLAEALAQGITQEFASCKPTRDGVVVDCNHATFIYGHLAIYPPMILAALGADASAVQVPESYNGLFMHGVDCQNDPDSTIYPPFEAVFADCMRVYEGVRAHLATVDDEALAQAITLNEQMAGVFGTNGRMALFMLHDHYMFHLGQLSTWRRLFGLGHAM